MRVLCRVKKPNAALTCMVLALKADILNKAPKSHIAGTQLNICAILSENSILDLALGLLNSCFMEYNQSANSKWIIKISKIMLLINQCFFLRGCLVPEFSSAISSYNFLTILWSLFLPASSAIAMNYPKLPSPPYSFIPNALFISFSPKWHSFLSISTPNMSMR